MKAYARMSLAAKSAYGALGSATHPGRSPKPPPPPEFICLECRHRVPHGQAAAHAGRCPGRKK